MRTLKPGWYVFNETNGQYLRGPYVHAESAGAVRHEMEMCRPSAEWNLQVVEVASPQRAERGEVK